MLNLPPRQSPSSIQPTPIRPPVATPMDSGGGDGGGGGGLGPQESLSALEPNLLSKQDAGYSHLKGHCWDCEYYGRDFSTCDLVDYSSDGDDPGEISPVAGCRLFEPKIGGEESSEAPTSPEGLEEGAMTNL